MTKEDPVFAALSGHGFEIAGDVCFGLWKDYAVSVRSHPNGHQIELAVRTDKKNKALVRTLIKEARRQVRGKDVISCVNAGNAVFFVLRSLRKAGGGEALPAALDLFTDLLRKNGLPPAETCAVCGGDHTDSLCMESSYQPVHAACMRRRAASTRDAVEDNENNGSIPLGIVGALLGTLAGLIPNVLTIVFLDRIFALLFALVPLAAMWGYRKFRGRQNAAAIVIVVLLSLASVLLLEVIVTAIAVAREFEAGLGLSLGFAFMYLFSAEGFVLFLRDSLMEWLFMGLGIFIAWRYLRQTNAVRLRDLDAALSTLRPDPRAAVPSDKETGPA